MGGGVKSAQSRFSIKRQQKIVDRVITDASNQLGLDLKNRNKNVRVKVINEKDWKKFGHGEHTLAFYRSQTNTIFIRKSRFSRLSRDDMVHENLHARSGDHRYQGHLSVTLEEGTVEYLSQYISRNSFRTKARKFTEGSPFTYRTEQNFVTNLMTLTGSRKNFLKVWNQRGFGQEGFRDDNNRIRLAQKLQANGARKTAKALVNDYYKSTSHNSIERSIYLRELNNEMGEIIAKNPSLLKRWAKLDDYEKNID